MSGRVVALFLLLGAGCATTSTGYLARVNEEVITGKELRLEFARHHYAMEDILGDEQEVRKYTERLVDRRLFVQEAYRIGLQDTPAVHEAVARFRGQKLVEAYVKEHVDDRGGVSDEELKAAHAQMNRQFEALQLVVATRPEADAALAALKKGADFEALAREKSIVESRKRGGLILVGYGADEALEAALAALKEGELSAPFQAAGGWEIVRLEKRKVVEPPPYDKVAPRIRAFLQRKKRTQLEQELYGPLWTKYDARVLDCAPTVDDLKKAVAAKATTPCATWQGGMVTVEALGKRVKLDQLGTAADGWPELRQALIEDLVARELVQREAEAAGYGARPEIVEKVQVYEDDQVEGALYRDFVIKDVKVGDADVRAYFEAHRDLFTDDAQYELAQVLVSTPEEAQQVVERLTKARQPFAEVALAFSKDDKSAAEGGRVGFVDKRNLVNEFAPIAALQEGELSAPISARDGYHVVKVLSIKPPNPLPFDKVADDARKRALEEKQAAEIKRWVAQLRAAARIEINEAGIRAYSRERTQVLARDQAAKAAAARASEEKAAAAKAAADKAAAEKAAAGTAGELQVPAPGPIPAPGPAPAAGARPAAPPATGAAPVPASAPSPAPAAARPVAEPAP